MNDLKQQKMTSIYPTLENNNSDLPERLKSATLSIRMRNDIPPPKPPHSRSGYLAMPWGKRHKSATTRFVCQGKEVKRELSFDKNMTVTKINDLHGTGWIKGTINGKRGYIPKSYIDYDQK
ncbi:unnamed protein product [Didymodactylos carnosus]|uniref:SH3 domain-containing protein n=1 Tax=Didymodactylos carnosus TaxID=1234261 RepID=A0A815Y3Z0_9BILA|nr:unnamed protein product [Didymodactylos carnosus]CAF1565654.1 unnamed protein product [Didymodactylos carnosus]CAF3703533.1 unnamed protein product [Didymodactylos carnosus]CAF4427813.1 unnamed protein product [Didymodactylos carnosus]